MPKRNFIQRIFGYCPCCDKWLRIVTMQRRMTHYINDEKNWLTACKQCHKEDYAHWEERRMKLMLADYKFKEN